METMKLPTIGEVICKQHVRWYKGKYKVELLMSFPNSRKALAMAIDPICFPNCDLTIPTGQKFITMIRLLWRHPRK